VIKILFRNLTRSVFFKSDFDVYFPISVFSDQRKE